MFDQDETIDEEQFIRDHLNFLIESDDEFSEGSENNSVHFPSYEETASIYGTSSIGSKVSETWSSTSFGSITSSKEATSSTSSNTDHRYFLDDISFNQEIPANSRLRDIDSIMYKAWRDTFACKSYEYFLRDKILHGEGLFSTSNPIGRMHDAYSKLAQELLPYSNLSIRRAELPLNYFSSSRVPSNPYADWSTLGAEEALNQYFAQQDHLNRQKLFSQPDLTNFASPIGRASTPINNENVQQFVDIDKTGAIPSEDYTVHGRKVAPSTSFEEVKVTHTGRPAKVHRSSKQHGFCKFCYKNGELSDIYMSHITKSAEGTIVCPILRKYVCDLCGATGDKAHTRKYCSLNKQQSKRPPVFRRLTNGVLTSCHNHK